MHTCHSSPRDGLFTLIDPRILPMREKSPPSTGLLLLRLKFPFVQCLAHFFLALNLQADTRSLSQDFFEANQAGLFGVKVRCLPSSFSRECPSPSIESPALVPPWSPFSDRCLARVARRSGGSAGLNLSNKSLRSTSRPICLAQRTHLRRSASCWTCWIRWIRWWWRITSRSNWWWSWNSWTR